MIFAVAGWIFANSDRIAEEQCPYVIAGALVFFTANLAVVLQATRLATLVWDHAGRVDGAEQPPDALSSSIGGVYKGAIPDAGAARRGRSPDVAPDRERSMTAQCRHPLGQSRPPLLAPPGPAL